MSNITSNKIIFAKKLREEREHLGLMQKEMAEKLNLPPNTYNGYETGKRSPSLEIATQIADALNVSADYLLGRTDNRNLTVKDEKSIKNDLKKMMTDLRTGQAGPAFYGDTELDEEELDLIEDAMELALKTIKLRNKEKYTPKKYKKDK